MLINKLCGLFNVSLTLINCCVILDVQTSIYIVVYVQINTYLIALIYTFEYGDAGNTTKWFVYNVRFFADLRCSKVKLSKFDSCD